MGGKLVSYYEEAKKTGGLKATMRLAMKTGVSSDKADAEPDSPETVSKFETAWSEIKKEFQ